jgi:hypothetical protein
MLSAKSSSVKVFRPEMISDILQKCAGEWDGFQMLKKMMACEFTFVS